MTILYEVFTIEFNEEFQYQDFIPLKYFNNKEEAIEYCRLGNQNGYISDKDTQNGHIEFYWREIIVD